jgi:hypothetical protein
MDGRDAIEVVAMLGDSVVDVAYVGASGYRLGTAPRLDLAVPGFACFTLLSGTTLRIAPGIAAEIVEGDRATPIDAPAFAIPAGGHVRARIGRATLAIRRTAAPRRTLPRGLRADRRAIGYLLGSIALHALLWGVVASAPPDEGTAATGFAFVPGSADLHPLVGASAAPAMELEDSPDHQRKGKGAPMASPAGAAGSLTSPRATGHIAIARRSSEPTVARLTHDQAVEAARQAGVLGSTALRADRFGTLISDVAISSGIDATNVYAPLFGGEGEASGQFGLGYRGEGTSGGCVGDGCGTIGSGRYGTMSNGTHAGDGWGGGRSGANGIGQRLRRDPKVPEIRMCGARMCAVSGGLDKAIIRRYMRRQNAKLQYCYEKQLLAHPDLSGVILVDFFIEPTGRVASASADGVDDAVASCLADVVRAIEFPGSRSATEVKYPIEFRLAGS